MSWGVYSVYTTEGAVGGGTVKYNPIGGGATGKDIDKVSGSVNNLKYGSTGSADDCTSSQYGSDSIPG